MLGLNGLSHKKVLRCLASTLRILLGTLCILVQPLVSGQAQRTRRAYAYGGLKVVLGYRILVLELLVLKPTYGLRYLGLGLGFMVLGLIGP